MKRTLLSLSVFLLLFTLTANAQYYVIAGSKSNPKHLNTDVEWWYGGGLPNTWALVDSCEADSAPLWTATQTIPFTFNFNGTDFTQVKISTSGVVTFDVATTLDAPSFTNVDLPSALIPDNSICVWGLKPVLRNFQGIGIIPNTIVTKTFGSAPNRQYWVQFNTYGEPGLKAGITCWSVVLEETTNNVYIVDMQTVCVESSGSLCTDNATSLTLGLQYSSTSAFSIGGSPNALSMVEKGQLVNPDNNIFYQFSKGTPPTYDVALESITNEAFQKGKAYKINGSIWNKGSETITSFKVNYTLDGGATVTETVSGVSISTSQYFDFESSLTPIADNGTKSFKVWISDLNGSNADVNPGDNAITKQIKVVDRLRVSLHEIFSSSTCGPCAPGNANYKAVVALRDKNLYTSVKYQQDFPGSGDPYNTIETTKRRDYYNINSIPRMEVDGQWNQNAQSFTNEVFDSYQGLNTNLEIEAIHRVYGKTVDVNVTLKPFADYTGDNYSLHVLIIEARTEKNFKTNGEREFFHVVKKMLPNEKGTAITGGMANGTNKDFNFTYTFPGSYKLPATGLTPIDLSVENSVEEFANLEVIVFVQNNTDKKIVQSFASVPTGPYNGVNDKALSKLGLKLYPNPASTSFTVSAEQNNSVSVRVFDLSGKTLINSQLNNSMETEINCSSLNNGLYFVEFTTADGQTAVQKLMISK